MAQKKQIQAMSFLVLLALMVIMMGRVFLPYATVLLWAAVLYILVSPVYHRIVHSMKPGSRFFELRRHILAGAFAIGTVLIMAALFSFVVFQVIGQGRLFIDEIKNFVEGNPHFFKKSEVGISIATKVRQLSLGSVDLSSVDIKAEALSFLSAYSDTIMSITRSLLTNLGNFLISLAFICFALYFFYVDGAYLAGMFIKAIPIAPESTKRLLSKFRDVTTNLFKGLFLVAFYQALAAFIIFTAFRVQGATLFSVLILFSSFIPMVGCALVWLPLGLSLAVSRSMTVGIAFMALCAIFISFLDNFLRPFFLKDRIKIHPLLIFFSILGGLKVFGLNGIILGPVVVILFFTIVDMALEEEGVSVSPHSGAPAQPVSGASSENPAPAKPDDIHTV